MFETIFHPSDFTLTSQAAFCHALRLALMAKADFRMLHVTRGDPEADLRDFPGVRETLSRWNILPAGAARGDVTALGIGVTKVVIRDERPVASIEKYLATHPASLNVMAAHRRSGWFEQSDAEAIAQVSGVTTLFVPDECRGFVDPSTGRLSLTNIVLPVSLSPDPFASFEVLEWFARQAGEGSVTFHVCHIGTTTSLPAVPPVLTDVASLEVDVLDPQRDIADQVIAYANSRSADLVVMPTAGRQGFLDALWGSTTEHVLRHVACPLLALPVP